jgi:hypothetical protein
MTAAHSITKISPSRLSRPTMTRFARPLSVSSTVAYWPTALHGPRRDAHAHAGQHPGRTEGLADSLHLDHGATDPANQCVRDPPGLASFTFDEPPPTAHAGSPATRSPTGSAPPKDGRKYCDSGEQEQEEGGDVPEGGQYHHAE